MLSKAIGNLDFVASGFGFVASGFDFVAPGLGFVAAGLVFVVGAYGLSHDPFLAERNRASMTRMFRIASSIGNSSGVAFRIAREKASPCSVY
jgi:hypothetical protein